MININKRRKNDQSEPRRTNYSVIIKNYQLEIGNKVCVRLCNNLLFFD